MNHSSTLSQLLQEAQSLGGVLQKAGAADSDFFLRKNRTAAPALDSSASLVYLHITAENEEMQPPEAALGTTTNFVSAFEENGLDYGENSKKNRYELADTAKRLLPNERITFCLHSLPTGASVKQDIDTGHAHISGVALCGLGWVCPVCATKIAMGRREEIAEGSKVAKEKGLQAYFVTYTASHSRDDSLIGNLSDMKMAMRSLRGSRKYRNLKKNIGMVGYIDAWEITYGFANGWHAHLHQVIFAEAGQDVAELEKEIFGLWDNSLSRLGLYASERHGVKVEKADEKVGNYLTKWTLEKEMTGSEFKKTKGKNSYTPMGLLALYQAGEKWAGSLFQEYAEATKGKSALRWSRGLRKSLGLVKTATDQELAEAEQGRKSRTLATFSPQLWQEIRRAGRRGVIGELLVVSSMGKDALDIWLGAVFGLGIDIEGQVKRRREKIPL